MSTPHTPASGLPALPPDAPPRPPGGGEPWRQRQHRRKPEPDAVTFYAECPGCGVLALWTQERQDTRTMHVIGCRICERRERMRSERKTA